MQLRLLQTRGIYPPTGNCRIPLKRHGHPYGVSQMALQHTLTTRGARPNARTRATQDQRSASQFELRSPRQPPRHWLAQASATESTFCFQLAGTERLPGGSGGLITLLLWLPVFEASEEPIQEQLSQEEDSGS